ncbi:predicted protein [Sclerotinia sclerotiorum 1980 UF-70]|uniref:Uncharacterized protein n=1 Tax=Sclerotinia sclerotiorum (strain ATCC 18683 / 1980 / Ss-1) TaxID=665079 RepID=A7EAW5_SCLS1|nr:predicted protein [Sclerotinia sclerotiorum 1980 UF-70]EDN99593.1 predicted protein [Sclerotinia sclerotiorum 1980 UF-70]
MYMPVRKWAAEFVSQFDQFSGSKHFVEYCGMRRDESRRACANRFITIAPQLMAQSLSLFLVKSVKLTAKGSGSGEYRKSFRSQNPKSS